MKLKQLAAILTAWSMVYAGAASISPAVGHTPFSGMILTANANEEVLHSQGLEYTVQSDGTLFVSGCDASLTSAEIPTEVNGLAVTGIQWNAFQDCTALTSITIPDSVTMIRENAFLGCTGLTEIRLPDSLTSIGYNTFNGCTGLTDLYLPNSIRVIGTSAFEGCTGLTSITIPDAVTSIGSSAFEGCTKLTDITLPDSITSIGETVFHDTAWYNAQEDGFVYLKDWLYAYKGYMPDHYVAIIKDGTIGIAGAAFGDYTEITGAILPNSMKYISGRAFAGCLQLTNITIPDGVINIGYRAFADCTELTEITIPDSVTLIDWKAFDECTKLTDITILSTDCEFYNSLDTLPQNAVIHGYEDSTAQSYAKAYNRTFVSLGEAPVKQLLLGDLNDDGTADATDASLILIAAAQAGASGSTGLSPEQETAADVNGDGQPDATDASIVLMYAASRGAGYDGSLEDYLNKMKF